MTMRKIIISDYTLRQMKEDSRDLLFREKTYLVSNINSVGVNRIELPVPENGKEDKIINKTLCDIAGKTALCIPGGSTHEEIKAAAKSLSGAKNPCLQIMLPVSTVKMEYDFHMKDQKMLEKAKDLCIYALTLCRNVEFAAIDATRAERDFLKTLCTELSSCGVSAITLTDSAGISLPDEIASLVRELRPAVSCTLLADVSNALSLAPACALAAIENGADGIKVTLSEDKNLFIADIAKLIKEKGQDLGISSSLDETKIFSTVDEILKSENRAAPEHEETSDGKNVFLLRGVSMEKASEAISSLGYSLSPDDTSKVYDSLVQILETKSTIGAKELDAIIASNAMQAPATYHLKSYSVQSNNLTQSVSYVVLTKEEEEINGVAYGDGPIVSLFKAAEQCFGRHFELEDFQIQSVTEGKEALGSALVKIRNEGEIISGSGVSSDILGASIRAFINAVNKILSK